MMWLIHEWFLRLARIRGQLESDASNGQEWLLRIRARILNFLVARYGAEGEAGTEVRQQPRPDPKPAHEYQMLLFPDAFEAPQPEKWAGGASAAPRKSKELRESLSDIRRINSDKRERWRWWP